MKQRCDWGSVNELMEAYHDTEWGVPAHDDRKLFEYFILDTFQAGLSWAIVLKKRENFRKAFDNFDARKIAAYDSKKIKALLADAGIIRNRLKILAAVENAKAFLAVQKEFGSFDEYVWQFVAGKPKVNSWKKLAHIPARTRESDEMSKDLKKRGFKFAGSVMCYAFMQGAGMVNDHTINCFRYKPLSKMH